MILHSEDTEFLLHISYLFIQIERWEDAQSLCELILEDDEENVDAMKLLGFALLYSGKYELAISICERALPLVDETIAADTLKKIISMARNKIRYG